MDDDLRVDAPAGEHEPLPLDGLTVLDFSQFLAGPSCALRLADLGARVIKVERPNGGDSGRDLALAGQRFGDASALFHTINRNKESYAADLKDAGVRPRIEALIARADVLIHNFRPGIMERLGLGYEAVAAMNPRIVYAGVSGYGTEGPWRDRPGQDLLLQALTGIARLSGDRDQAPTPAALPIVDMAAGTQLTQGVLALLVRRGVTGRGGRVDVSLLDAAIDLQLEPFTVFLNGGGAPERGAVRNANVYLAAPYGIYDTADGHIALAMMPVDRLGEVIGNERLAEWPADAWLGERDAIKAEIARHLVTGTTSEWLALLEAAGLWAGEVLDWPALVERPGFVAAEAIQTIGSGERVMRTTVSPIRIDGRRLRSPRPGPALGEGNGRIDAELEGEAR
jgi:crotonobetainyl-CoA:carnitine CoA-transferase CaiB-like acyl-CoA transferase